MMNIERKNVYLFILLLIQGALIKGSSFIEEATKFVPTSDAKIFTTIIEEKQRLLNELKNRREQVEQGRTKYVEEVKSAAQEVKNQIHALKQAGSLELDDFSSQKLNLLSQLYQVLKDIAASWERGLTYIDTHIRYLTEYLMDPEFQEYKATLLKGRTSFSFEDFQHLYQLRNDQEKKLNDLIEKEKNVTVGLINRREAAEATIQAYKRKKAEFEEHESFANEGKTTQLVLDHKQYTELWLLEEKYFQSKQQLDNLQLEEFSHRISLLKTKKFVAQLRLDAIKDVLAQVKAVVKISEADVALAREELSKKTQQSFTDRERYRQAIDKLLAEQKLQERALQMARMQYNVSMDKELNYWGKEVKQTIEAFGAFVVVGHLYEQLLLTKRKKDLLRAQRELEEEKLRLDQLLIQIKDTFRKIISSTSLSEEQIIQETKKYQGLKAEVIAVSSHAKERENSARDLLERQKRVLERIEVKRDQVQKLRNTLFKNYAREYNQCIEVLNSAYEKVKIQVEIISKTVTVYADIIATGNKEIRQIGFIIRELAQVPIVWHRPAYAISWQGIKNAPNDIALFLTDTLEHASQFKLMYIGDAIKNIASNQSVRLWWLLQLIILAVVLLLFRMVAPLLIRFCNHFPDLGFGSYIIVQLCSCVLQFTLAHFTLLCLWSVGWLITSLYTVFAPYPFVLFLLFSIPFGLYMALRFINYLSIYNKRYDHIFWEEHEYHSFMWALSFLLYGSIIFLLIRQAFITGSYRRSEVPAILLAGTFILFQVSLLLLIVRECMRPLMTSRSEAWRTFYSHFDRYYYLIITILTAIIVMSNPYIGYGRLLIYMATRTGYTAVLVGGLVAIHFVLRRAAAKLFLFDESEGGNERFVHGRTWYGATIVLLLLGCVLIGSLGIAKIWGWPETLHSISGWQDLLALLKTPFLLEKTPNPISTYTILYILLFVAFGTIISSLVNRFMLERVYGILVVDAGVQNTVSSLFRYLIITTAIILGFQAVGLSSLVTYLIGALIIGIGWVIKDPMGDVLAYFIILVQRPLKVGDLVQIDDDTLGVVRKITPRSVIVRKKNSNTVVVPNTMILHKPIVNWNYVQGFIAFDDIMISISYEADPLAAREILIKVLMDNPYILKNPKPVVRLDNFGEYGYTFMVRGYINSNYTLDMWDIASEVRLNVVKALKEKGIKIAVPIRVLMNKSINTIPSLNNENE